MSPLLFHFYISQLVACFDEDCEPVSMGDLGISSLQFVDDVLVLAGSEAGFKRALTLFDGFSESVCLSVNPTKTCVVVFGHKGGGPPVEHGTWVSIPYRRLRR